MELDTIEILKDPARGLHNSSSGHPFDQKPSLRYPVQENGWKDQSYSQEYVSLFDKIRERICAVRP